MNSIKILAKGKLFKPSLEGILRKISKIFSTVQNHSGAPCSAYTEKRSSLLAYTFYSIVKDDQHCSFTREGNVYWIRLKEHTVNFNAVKTALTAYFHGKPKEAIRPPWDGGWIWKKDKNNNPWMSVACQGFGCQCLVSMQGCTK